MPLEARALEPLRLYGLALLIGVLIRLGDRQAEQRQVLGIALAAPPIKLQAVGRPLSQKADARLLVADGVPGLREVHAASHRAWHDGLGCPVDAALLERFGAQPPEQHVIGPRALLVQLEALALEVLDRAASFDQLARDREAKHGQPTVLLPELAELQAAMWQAFRRTYDQLLASAAL